MGSTVSEVAATVLDMAVPPEEQPRRNWQNSVWLSRLPRSCFSLISARHQNQKCPFNREERRSPRGGNNPVRAVAYDPHQLLAKPSEAAAGPKPRDTPQELDPRCIGRVADPTTNLLAQTHTGSRPRLTSHVWVPHWLRSLQPVRVLQSSYLYLDFKTTDAAARCSRILLA